MSCKDQVATSKQEITKVERKEHNNLAKALNVVKKMVKKKDELVNNVIEKKRKEMCAQEKKMQAHSLMKMKKKNFFLQTFECR
jgi:pantothenate synthetase